MKKLLLTTAMVSVMMLAGCANNYGASDTVVINKKANGDTTTTATGNGVKQIDVYIQESNSSTHSSSYSEDASLVKACKSFPNHPKCK